MSHTVICALCILTHLNFTMTSFFRTIDIESPQNIKTACFSSLLSFFFSNQFHQYLLWSMSNEYSFNLYGFNL